MKDFIVSPDAEEDLFRIWLYLRAEGSERVAERIEKEIIDSFGFLAEVPGAGHRRRDLTGLDVLFHTVYQYTWLCIGRRLHWASWLLCMGDATWGVFLRPVWNN